MLMSKLIIVDDNPRDRSFLAEIFTDFDVQQTANADEALAACRNSQEPFVITDIQMPDTNGIELAEKIWSEFDNARILFWSQYSDETYVRALAKLTPADTVYGYVLKNNTTETILRAAEAVFQFCQCWIDPSVRRVQARSQNNQSSLSDAEYEVLIDIALGLTDNTIAQRRYLSRRGVQNRLQSLYSKLGANMEKLADKNESDMMNARSRAVAIALQRGLINHFQLEKEEKLLNDWIKTAR